MVRLARTFAIFLLAVAVVANLRPSFGMAPASAPADHLHSVQPSNHDHHGAAHADHSASSPAKDADCHPGHGATYPSGHSGTGEDCDKCCGICITASVIPVIAMATVPLVVLRDSLWTWPSVLTPYRPSSDPDIPKPLT
jgi:hypothetical protein